MSSLLLETELRRLAVGLGIEQATISAVLGRLDLAEPDHGSFVTAGLMPGPGLRSLDALHLAAALRLTADLILTYDRRMLDAAVSLGLAATSPTR